MLLWIAVVLLLSTGREKDGALDDGCTNKTLMTFLSLFGVFALGGLLYPLSYYTTKAVEGPTQPHVCKIFSEWDLHNAVMDDIYKYNTTDQ